MTKTDNHNVGAKLALRRHFLQKYHGDKTAETLDVLDCCQGSGLLWRELKKEFTCDSYLGVDLKPQKGRLKIDSVRILDQSGWKFNCIDVDTYGSPWKHWFALLRHFPSQPLNRSTVQPPLGLTVFLTVGIVPIGGGGVDGETMRALGLVSLGEKLKARGLRMPVTVVSRVRDRVGLEMLAGARDHRLEIVEAQEAENIGGHARYFGIRLSPS